MLIRLCLTCQHGPVLTHPTAPLNTITLLDRVEFIVDPIPFGLGFVDFVQYLIGIVPVHGKDLWIRGENSHQLGIALVLGLCLGQKEVFWRAMVNKFLQNLLVLL